MTISWSFIKVIELVLFRVSFKVSGGHYIQAFNLIIKLWYGYKLGKAVDILALFRILNL